MMERDCLWLRFLNVSVHIPLSAQTKRKCSKALALRPGGRRCADRLAKHTGKVRLIGKARFGSNDAHRQFVLQHQLLGPLDAGLHLPLVRRETGRGLEGMAEIGLRQTGKRCQFFKTNAAQAVFPPI